MAKTLNREISKCSTPVLSSANFENMILRDQICKKSFKQKILEK